MKSPPHPELDCDNCPYWGRVKVWGEGVESATVAFIGQSPGSQEVKQKRPFVGPAGIRLNKVFDALPIDREEVYITNIVKCFLRTGEVVQRRAVSSCWPLLQTEIESKRLIVLLGKPASEAFQEHYREGAALYRMVHPAAALRRAKYEALLRQQTKGLKEVIDGLLG